MFIISYFHLYLQNFRYFKGCAPCTAVVFLLAQKDDGTAQAAFSCRFAAIHLELRQAFPLHSLCSASAMTLLPAELRIVHRRMVHTPVFAPQGARMEKICKSHNSHKPTRGARNRRNGNASTSDTHGSNDKRSGLSTRKGNHQKRSFWFSF